ncbi:hypothetical protein QEH52_19260 [Coraliomargarita sp. SDUM461003]|uniref:Uncharacterized protein n=1 Tax=Thalassobacterium maritimum TaxID=3041265 RepID=A0ABU1AZU5_9BACT|nr:hypothetical protein [Coraliomargarita sp. SDUM461003]MDQ8209666.1 hypothetical protein [Coraliomargarita sp. SDUM461003]
MITNRRPKRALSIPGAILDRVYGYKKGVLVGLGIYILGGLLCYLLFKLGALLGTG